MQQGLPNYCLKKPFDEQQVTSDEEVSVFFVNLGLRIG
jgi:hypothetical protein